jgi:hypothetical protein
VTSEIALLADSGAASSAPEFFRSKQFLAIEGVTHTLRAQSGNTQVYIPLIVRAIPGIDEFDAISPYGYPGGSLTAGVFDLATVDLSITGLVSIFIRDRIGMSTLRNGRARSHVYLYDPHRPRRIRESVLRAIRGNEELGYRSELIRGCDVTNETLAELARCYWQTMGRVGAARRYFFSLDYLGACFSFDDSWLAATWSPDGSLASGMIIVRSDMLLHYYLGGTATAHVATSPSKNTYMVAVELSRQLAHPMNFGGGRKPGDGLEHFKKGFSNRVEEFVTHELICDHNKYFQLAGSGVDRAFFPGYRRD